MSCQIKRTDKIFFLPWSTSDKTHFSVIEVKLVFSAAQSTTKKCFKNNILNKLRRIVLKLFIACKKSNTTRSIFLHSNLMKLLFNIFISLAKNQNSNLTQSFILFSVKVFFPNNYAILCISIEKNYMMLPVVCEEMEAYASFLDSGC